MFPADAGLADSREQARSTLVLAIFAGTAMINVEVPRFNGHLVQDQRYGETAVIVVCD